MEKDTEAQILEAAKKVFLRKGFDGARMQEIADEAKINKSMLHYYFRSKEFLFERIMRESLEIMFPTLMMTIGGEGTVIEKAEALVDAYTHNIISNPHIPMFVMYELSRNRVDFMEKMKEKMEMIGQPKGFFNQILTEQEQGILKIIPPEQVLINIISLIVFPFLAKPMLKGIFHLSDEKYTDMMIGRKAITKVFLREALLK